MTSKTRKATLSLPKGVTLRGSSYRVSVQVNGVRKTATCSTLQDALDAIDQIKKGKFQPDLTANGTRSVWSLQEAWDSYIDYRLSVSKKSNPKQFNWYGKTILDYFGPATSLDEIRGASLQDFFDKLTTERSYSASLVNYVGTLLVMLQRHAYKRGRMSFEPERMPTRRLTKGRIRFLTVSEEKAMLNWFTSVGHDRYAQLVSVYIDTGMRKSELLNLKWSDVDLDTGRITIWINKTDNPRTIRMTKRVKDILQNIKQEKPKGSERVIFGHVSERHLYRTWYLMKDAIGLTDDDQFVIHMLRHTCCTRLLGAGVDIRSVMEWMGHSSLTITQRYAHFIPQKLDDAASALDRAGTEGKQ